MSAGVLAVMAINPYKGSIGEAWQRGFDGARAIASPGSAYMATHADGVRAREARATVAELIEADKAFDAAHEALDNIDKHANPAYRAAVKAQVVAAIDRRAAALSRANGGTEHVG